MKKTAMKISGNITLILFFVLFLVAALNSLALFELDFASNLLHGDGMLGGIILLIAYAFVGMPQLLLQAAGLSLEGNTLAIVLSLVFCVFSFLMFLWGIKEIKLSKLDDEKFARCKKTCAFMMITKFAFFAYLVAAVICSVMIDEFSVAASAFSSMLNVPYIFLIVTGVLTFIAFLMFVLPVANIFTVASAVKQDQANFAPADGYVAGSQNEINVDNSEQMNEFYSQQPAPTMQANMPPIPGFRPQVASQPQPQQNAQSVQPQPAINQPAQQVVNTNVQPINNQPQVAPNPQVAPQQTVVQPVGQTNVAPQTNVQPAPQVNQPQVAPAPVVQPQPSQNVVPQQAPIAQPAPTQVVQPAPQAANVSEEQLVANLTEQGVAELQRIDRLKSIGAITEQNYAAMRQRIINSNQK